VASIGSFIETVPDFRKTTGRVSDGPTSHAILGQVPGADLEYILTDFLKERLLRRTLLGGSRRDAPPGNFLPLSSSLISGFLSHSDRILASVQLGSFSIQNISIYDRFSSKVGNRCGSAPEFYCGFLRLRGDYLRNKSTELIMWPLFLIRLRQGKILSTVVFSISLGAMYFGMIFHILYFGIFFW